MKVAILSNVFFFSEAHASCHLEFKQPTGTTNMLPRDTIIESKLCNKFVGNNRLAKTVSVMSLNFLTALVVNTVPLHHLGF